MVRARSNSQSGNSPVKCDGESSKDLSDADALNANQPADVKAKGTCDGAGSEATIDIEENDNSAETTAATSTD
jgi:hypothetical protein